MLNDRKKDPNHTIRFPRNHLKKQEYEEKIKAINHKN